MRSDFTPKLILQRAIRVFVLLKLITSFMSSEGENNRHLHDGIILLTRPECFVKMLSNPNLSPPLGRKRQLEN